MKASDYFKKTFVFVFVFSLAYRIVIQLFDGLDSFNIKFFLKTLFVSILTALIYRSIKLLFQNRIYQKKQ